MSTLQSTTGYNVSLLLYMVGRWCVAAVPLALANSWWRVFMCVCKSNEILIEERRAQKKKLTTKQRTQKHGIEHRALHKVRERIVTLTVNFVPLCCSRARFLYSRTRTSGRHCFLLSLSVVYRTVVLLPLFDAVDAITNGFLYIQTPRRTLCAVLCAIAREQRNISKGIWGGEGEAKGGRATGTGGYRHQINGKMGLRHCVWNVCALSFIQCDGWP